MEIIRLEGYTDTEKLEIASKYLVPKQLKESGLSAKLLRFSDNAIIKLINGYTREPGVRGLERQINAICRKVAHSKVKGENWNHTIDPEDVVTLLGPAKFRKENVRPKVIPGVVNGLAWTESGGDILQIEVSVVPGKGKLTITGKLGEVMNESAQAAMTYVRSRQPSCSSTGTFIRRSIFIFMFRKGLSPKTARLQGLPWQRLWFRRCFHGMSIIP